MLFFSSFLLLGVLLLYDWFLCIMLNMARIFFLKFKTNLWMWVQQTLVTVNVCLICVNKIRLVFVCCGTNLQKVYSVCLSFYKRLLFSLQSAMPLTPVDLHICISGWLLAVVVVIFFFCCCRCDFCEIRKSNHRSFYRSKVLKLTHTQKVSIKSDNIHFGLRCRCLYILILYCSKGIWYVI